MHRKTKQREHNMQLSSLSHLIYTRVILHKSKDIFDLWTRVKNQRVKQRNRGLLPADPSLMLLLSLVSYSRKCLPN